MVSISLAAVAPLLASSVNLFFLNAIASDNGAREIVVDVGSRQQNTPSYPVKFRAKTGSPLAAMQSSQVSPDTS